MFRLTLILQEEMNLMADPMSIIDVDGSSAIYLIFMVIGILFRYAAKYTATKVTGGSQDYFYEQLVILIIDAYQHGGDSFILQQHWPEAYLAWLRAAPPEDLFRVGSYARQSIK